MVSDHTLSSPFPARHKSGKNKPIPALDGLRGLAVLLVVSFHYFGEYAIFSLGWAGVDLFFVLSGFLITKRLMETRENHDRYSRFYINRALRIMPLYYLVLILFFMAVLFLVDTRNINRFEYYKESWVSFFLFLQNWTFINKDHLFERHLFHFWSLAVEEQFYLLWPVVFYSFYSKKYFKPALLIAVSGILLTRCLLYYVNPHFQPPHRYYDNTFLRIDTIMIGAMTYLVTEARPKNNLVINILLLISMAILITGLFTVNNLKSSGPFFGTIGYTLLAIIFASILYRIVISSSSLICKFFNNSFLRKTGKISYGLYIFHWPVILVLGGRISTFIRNFANMNEEIVSLISATVCMVLSFALSLLSFRYYESYFLNRKR